eukprot:4605000-Prymnesium_polylepis.2
MAAAACKAARDGEAEGGCVLRAGEEASRADRPTGDDGSGRTASRPPATFCIKLAPGERVGWAGRFWAT